MPTIIKEGMVFMSDIKKFKRVAMVLSIVTGLVILWFTFQQVRGIYFTFVFVSNMFVDANLSFYSFLALSFASIPIILASLIISFSLLYSIRKNETPFTRKTAVKLKVIAFLLVALELCVFASQRILYTFFLRFANANYIYVMEVSLGGVVVVLGIVVYCIALVFEYGISLQNQVDETL